MSDATSAIGSAAVSTIGTVAVAGMAMKAVGKATSGIGKSRKHSNYNVWHGTKRNSSRKRNSMLSY